MNSNKLIVRSFKSYDELEFSDSFMFMRVMSDPEIAKGVLERILGRQIKRVEIQETEKDIDIDYMAKGIRLDVYLAGSDARYDIEMQAYPQHVIGKRSRYYQGIIDIDSLKSGESYEMIKDSFVIFICLNDPFGLGISRYTFTEQCHEAKQFNTEIDLETGATKIILFAGGNTDNESPEMKQFLDFVANHKIHNGDTLLNKISKKVTVEKLDNDGRKK